MPTYTLKDTGSADETGEGFSLIEDGTVLEAEVLSIEEKLMPFKDKDTGDDVFKLEFTFRIMQEPYENRRMWGQTSTNFARHPQCVLYSWTQEIIGQELPSGFQLDTDALIGERCRIAVGVREYPDKKNPNEDGTFNIKQVNYVFDVIRSKSKAGFDDGPF